MRALLHVSAIRRIPPWDGAPGTREGARGAAGVLDARRCRNLDQDHHFNHLGYHVRIMTYPTTTPKRFPTNSDLA